MDLIFGFSAINLISNDVCRPAQKKKKIMLTSVMRKIQFRSSFNYKYL